MSEIHAEVRDEEFSAFVGPKWETYYRKRFTRVPPDDDPGFNLWACLLQTIWLAYRGMWLPAVATVVLGQLQGFLQYTFVRHDSPLDKLMSLCANVAWLVVLGTQGNVWYLRHARRKIAVAKAEGIAHTEFLAELARRGGTHPWAAALALGMFVAFALIAKLGS